MNRAARSAVPPSISWALAAGRVAAAGPAGIDWCACAPVRVQSIAMGVSRPMRHTALINFRGKPKLYSGLLYFNVHDKLPTLWRWIICISISVRERVRRRPYSAPARSPPAGGAAVDNVMVYNSGWRWPHKLGFRFVSDTTARSTIN